MLFESDGGDGELSFRLFVSFVVPLASTRLSKRGNSSDYIRLCLLPLGLDRSVCSS